MSTYNVYHPPATRLSVGGTAIQLSETATVVAASGTYLFSAGAALHIRITDASDTTTPTATNGISFAADEKLFIYLKAGQFVHSDSTSGIYILMEEN